MDGYEPVNSEDYRNLTKMDDYSIRTLDNTFISHLRPHLHSGDEPDKAVSPRKAITVKEEVDGRGSFQRAEVSRELKRLSRAGTKVLNHVELEGRLGISSHKLDDILKRAERRTKEMAGKKIVRKGEVKYNAFLEVVREYRMNTEQESNLKAAIRVFAYVEEFTCVPPALVMVAFTCIELVMFVYMCLVMSQNNIQPQPITWSGPIPYCSHLIYNPKRRWEIWRFFSYMFVHIGIGHFFFNMLMQIIVGVFLEMEQEGWIGSLKVAVVYLSGVLAGSLGTSLSDPNTFIAGASGGVYALIAAHLATMTLNWREDSQIRIQKVIKRPITKIIRMTFIIILTVHDTCFAIYVRLYDPENPTGFMGHLCGALAGLTVGLFILDNRMVRPWEPVVQWISFGFFVVFTAFAIVWNVYGNDWSPGFFPQSDSSLYEVGTCSRLQFM